MLIGVFASLESIKKEEREDSFPMQLTFFTMEVCLEPMQFTHWQRYPDDVQALVLHELGRSDIKLAGCMQLYGHVNLYFSR